MVHTECGARNRPPGRGNARPTPIHGIPVHINQRKQIHEPGGNPRCHGDGLRSGGGGRSRDIHGDGYGRKPGLLALGADGPGQIRFESFGVGGLGVFVGGIESRIGLGQRLRVAFDRRKDGQPGGQGTRGFKGLFFRDEPRPHVCSGGRRQRFDPSLQFVGDDIPRIGDDGRVIANRGGQLLPNGIGVLRLGECRGKKQREREESEILQGVLHRVVGFGCSIGRAAGGQRDSGTLGCAAWIRGRVHSLGVTDARMKASWRLRQCWRAAGSSSASCRAVPSS